MWPLPLVFVLPRDWETLDFFSFRSFRSFFSLGSFFFGAGEDGEGEEEAAGIEPWNIPLSLLIPRAQGRDPAWESLLVSSTPSAPPGDL